MRDLLLHAFLPPKSIQNLSVRRAPRRIRAGCLKNLEVLSRKPAFAADQTAHCRLPRQRWSGGFPWPRKYWRRRSPDRRRHANQARKQARKQARLSVREHGRSLVSCGFPFPQPVRWEAHATGGASTRLPCLPALAGPSGLVAAATWPRLATDLNRS